MPFSNNSSDGKLERPVRKRPEIVEALAKLREEIEAIGDDFAHNEPRVSEK